VTGHSLGGTPVNSDEGMTTSPEHSEARLLVPSLMFVTLVVAAVSSLGTWTTCASSRKPVSTPSPSVR
jgi:hypothetical protein